MEIDVGRTIAGKYALMRLLGRGSMGEVWMAHHTSLGENVALKVLTQTAEGALLEDGATAVARFRFEAQVAARLSRKTRHIVRVTDHGEEDGVPYIVMELLEGETLEARLAREGAVSVALATALVAQVGRALAQAHAEGVLHRDLKPANVFLSRDEEGNLLAKLLDFGIARAAQAHRAPPSAVTTARGVLFGTPSYMSPEQARASSKLDHRCDLWALSTIAFELLTGERPLDGNDTDEVLGNLCAGRVVALRTRSPGMPASLDAFFARSFAEDVGARFQSAGELVAAFERAAGSGATSTRPATASASGRPDPVCATSSGPGSAVASADRSGSAAARSHGGASGPSWDSGGAHGGTVARPPARQRAVVLAVTATLFALASAGAVLRLRTRSAPAGPDAHRAPHTAVEAPSPPAMPSASPTATSTELVPSVPVTALPRAQPPPRPPAKATTPEPPKKVDKGEVF